MQRFLHIAIAASLVCSSYAVAMPKQRQSAKGKRSLTKAQRVKLKVAMDKALTAYWGEPWIVPVTIGEANRIGQSKLVGVRRLDPKKVWEDLPTDAVSSRAVPVEARYRVTIRKGNAVPIVEMMWARTMADIHGKTVKVQPLERQGGVRNQPFPATKKLYDAQFAYGVDDWID